MKTKTVCFSYVLHLFQPTLLAFIRVNGHYKHQTPLTTTHKFENLHTLQRKLDARTLLPTVRPSSSPVLAKKKVTFIQALRLNAVQYNIRPKGLFLSWSADFPLESITNTY